MSAHDHAPIPLWERIADNELRIKVGMQRDEIAQLRRDLARAERVALALAVVLVLLAIVVAARWQP